MNTLKGTIFSLRGVLTTPGKVDDKILNEVVKLIQYLISINVEPILISNSPWNLTFKDGKEVPFQEYLSEVCGRELKYYQAGIDFKAKQYAASMEKILSEHGWNSSEVIYVGNTREDMIAASNGGFLFLNAKWHGDNSPYGFHFSDPRDIGRFIECCCVTPQNWFWGIEKGNLRVYSIAPLAQHSKSYPSGAIYSTDAKLAVKQNAGQTRFWGLLMAARIHLSGIGAEANYVAPYPGHRTNSRKTVLMNAVRIVSQSLRAQYLHDFIERHCDAKKLQHIRNKGQSPTVGGQLDTIKLIPNPIKHGSKKERYKNRPKISGKTILVVDDICTEGHSFETARAFLEAAGAKVILVSWLKTPGGSYHALESICPRIKSPFQEYSLENHTHQVHPFGRNEMNESASEQIATAYTRYNSWNWPNGI